MTAVKTDAAVSYRGFQEDDLPGVLALWDEAGWGHLDEATWRQWYRDTPHGDARIWVVESGRGKIMGQLVFTPSEVDVAGTTVKALRSSAYILHPDLRRASLGRRHPLVELTAVSAADVAAEGHYALGYGFPHPVMYAACRWLAEHEVLPVQLWRLPCFMVSGTTRDDESGLVELSVDVLTGEHQALAAGTAAALGARCYVRRSLAWMRWRIGGNRLVEVRVGDDRPAALAAVRQADDLLNDLYVSDASCVEPVLAAAARRATNGTVVVPGLPALFPALERLQAEPVAGPLAFACWSYDTSVVPSEEIAPERWFPMHAD